MSKERIDSLTDRLQMVYDVLLNGTDKVPNWDRLAGLSAVGEGIEQLRKMANKIDELEVTIDDEESAHAETLRMLAIAKAQGSRRLAEAKIRAREARLAKPTDDNPSPRVSIEQHCRDLLDTAIKIDNTVAYTPDFADPLPQSRSAGELVGMANHLARILAQAREKPKKPSIAIKAHLIPKDAS